MSVQIATIRTKNGWLRFEAPALFSRVSGPSADLAIVQPVRNPRDREIGVVSQIVLYALNEPTTARPLQHNDSIHAVRIVHWDLDTNILFYLGCTQLRPQRRNLYAIQVDARVGGRSRTDCLTCRLHQRAGNDYHAHFMAAFNPKSRYLLLESQGPAVPRHDVYEWLVEQRTGAVRIQVVRPIQTFERLRASIENVTLPLLRFERVTKKDGYVARVKMLMPPQFVTCNSSSTRYPMLVKAYSGPGTYVGATTWSPGWEWFMAVNRSVVVAMVDARGSGRLRLHETFGVYGNLGWTEAEDLIETAQ